MPEFDWAVEGRWSQANGRWERVSVRDKVWPGVLTFRVSVPAQATQHEKITVHTVWTPGSPPRPRCEYRQSYGFRRREGSWQCTVYKHSRDDAGFIFDPAEWIPFDGRFFSDNP